MTVKTTPPRVYLTEEQILARVDELAHRVSTDYAGVEELILVGVLKGAFVFLADLSRRLTIPRRVEFISVSSYVADSTTPGAVRLLLDLRSDIRGQHVLLVEDIVDTAHTIEYLLKLLAAREPASLKSCALLQKPERNETDVEIDYLGFPIPDAWVVGYGLDYNDQYRTLPYIGVVEPGEHNERGT